MNDLDRKSADAVAEQIISVLRYVGIDNYEAARKNLLTLVNTASLAGAAMAEDSLRAKLDPRPITPEVWREVTGEMLHHTFTTKPGDPTRSLSWNADNGSVYLEAGGMFVRLPNVRTAGDLRETLRLLGEKESEGA